VKILVSNDDGVYADGINSLNNELSKTNLTTVVAPLEERSTTGHTLSLDNPLRVIKISDNVYGCSGFPADCSLIGFGHILKDDKPDIVVSGINRGANLGQDIFYSGTMAAAREAVFHGIPGIAVSTALDLNLSKQPKIHFDTAAKFISTIIADGVLDLISPLHVVNVNVPNIEEKDIKGVKLCSLAFRKYSEEISNRTDFRDRDYFWVGGRYEGYDGDEKTDCYAVENNYISISILNLLGKEADKLSNWTQFLSKY
jgi:5'-nucleotidase